MARITARARRNLDTSQFALSGRRYPIHDAAHARAALAMGAKYASPADLLKIRAAVHKRYPGIK